MVDQGSNENEFNESKEIVKTNNVTKTYILEDEMVKSETMETNILASLINKQLKGRIVNVVNNNYKPYVCTLFKPDHLFASFPMNDKNVIYLRKDIE